MLHLFLPLQFAGNVDCPILQVPHEVCADLEVHGRDPWRQTDELCRVDHGVVAAHLHESLEGEETSYIRGKSTKTERKTSIAAQRTVNLKPTTIR